jgi:GntR family transcriptional regulator / MocR family aminotransferase
MGPIRATRRTPDTGLTLGAKPRGTTLTRWLYDELRTAILSGRLRRGSRIPASRDLAVTYALSRRIVVAVFEQLRDEGYVTSRVGVGTVVSEHVPDDYAAPAAPRVSPTVLVDRTPTIYRRPPLPFRAFEPALEAFPMTVWATVASRVLRRLSARALAGGDLAGLKTLREAIAGYLGASRGVACAPDHIVIVSGAQQALDLLARLVLRPGDAVWMEDPGYDGAVQAFRNAAARVVPVRVDDRGLDPVRGERLCSKPSAVYLTPAHQFPLGTTLSLERRFHLLRWARANDVVVIEDDYDSEFRFSGRPVPAMKGLDDHDVVFLIGTFNKALFPSLRLGYVVVPDRWMDRLLALRHQMDRYPPGISQAVLARFIEEGHWGRHLRRMREIYGRRRLALVESVDRHLHGAIALPDIPAGLSTPAYLLNGMSSRHAAERASTKQLEVSPLDRFALQRRDLHGLLLGFAAFSESEIRAGVERLAAALI